VGGAGGACVGMLDVDWDAAAVEGVASSMETPAAAVLALSVASMDPLVGGRGLLAWQTAACATSGGLTLHVDDVHARCSMLAKV
jgi:hypothetical protein